MVFWLGAVEVEEEVQGVEHRLTNIREQLSQERHLETSQLMSRNALGNALSMEDVKIKFLKKKLKATAILTRCWA